jgi:hypothetical protein
MKRQLPTKLDGEFWFSLTMIVVSIAVAVASFVFAIGYMGSLSLLWTVLFGFRLWRHVADFRLAIALKRNPELMRIYDKWNR